VRKAVLALLAVAAIGCHRPHDDARPAAPRQSEPARAESEANGSPHVSKRWKGRVAAANIYVGVLWFSPHAGIDGPAVQTEAKQILDENGAFATEAPRADVVIVKATTGASAAIVHVSHTESFVFERNHDGTWEYTEKYDGQFARLGL
jgi:hypothetical protein